MLAIGALAIGCGGDGESSRLAALAPPDAPLYIEAAMPPGDDERDAIESLAERVGGISDPGGQATAALDRLFSENQVDATYADDVEPWLSGQAAVFVRSFESDGGSSVTPDFAAMVGVEDPEAASDFLQRLVDEDPAPDEQREYEGTDYYVSGSQGFAAGVVDESALVFGTEMSFKVAVDASQGESLAESEEYSDRVDELPEDPLATAFFEPAGLVAALEGASDMDPGQAHALEPLLGGALSQPVAAALSVAETAPASTSPP